MIKMATRKSYESKRLTPKQFKFPDFKKIDSSRNDSAYDSELGSVSDISRKFDSTVSSFSSLASKDESYSLTSVTYDHNDDDADDDASHSYSHNTEILTESEFEDEIFAQNEFKWNVQKTATSLFALESKNHVIVFESFEAYLAHDKSEIGIRFVAYVKVFKNRRLLQLVKVYTSWIVTDMATLKTMDVNVFLPDALEREPELKEKWLPKDMFASTPYSKVRLRNPLAGRVTIGTPNNSVEMFRYKAISFDDETDSIGQDDANDTTDSDSEFTPWWKASVVGDNWGSRYTKQVPARVLDQKRASAEMPKKKYNIDIDRYMPKPAGEIVEKESGTVARKSSRSEKETISQMVQTDDTSESLVPITMELTNEVASRVKIHYKATDWCFENMTPENNGWKTYIPASATDYRFNIVYPSGYQRWHTNEKAPQIKRDIACNNVLKFENSEIVQLDAEAEFIRISINTGYVCHHNSNYPLFQAADAIRIFTDLNWSIGYPMNQTKTTWTTKVASNAKEFKFFINESLWIHFDQIPYLVKDGWNTNNILTCFRG